VPGVLKYTVDEYHPKFLHSIKSKSRSFFVSSGCQQQQQQALHLLLAKVMTQSVSLPPGNAMLES
jgi:hypothetical protein